MPRLVLTWFTLFVVLFFNATSAVACVDTAKWHGTADSNKFSPAMLDRSALAMIDVVPIGKVAAATVAATRIASTAGRAAASSMGRSMASSAGRVMTSAARSGVGSVAAESVPGKFTVGICNDTRRTVPGLDAHHVGQKAVMSKLISGYDPATAPSILVPKVGHTIRGPSGIVSRGTEGFTSARDVIARDIKELRGVYPDVPNSKLQELIQLNKDLYPAVRK